MNPAKLTETLTVAADRFTGPGLEIDQVLARAGEIQRGRRMRASMVMAAVVLAVAVPVGITALDSDPAESKAPQVASKPDTSELGLGDLKAGEAPRTGYLSGNELHAANIAIPVGSGGEVVNLARIDGGFLVARSSPSNGDLVATFIGDDGNTLDASWPTTGSFVVSPEGNVGAFAEPDGTVVAVQDGGSRYFEIGKIPRGDSFDVAAVDGENCSGRSEEVGCTVYVESNDAHPKVWAVSPNRTPEVSFPQFQDLTGIAPDGTVAGMVSATDVGSCSEAQDVDGTTLWDTCTNRFSAFSPDGKHLLGAGAYGDGFGDSQLAVVDAGSGQVLLDLKTVPDATITSMVWEDDAHVLATVFYQNKAAVIRLELNGHREYALDPTAASYDARSPYLLSSR